MALLWMEGFEGYGDALDGYIEDGVDLRYHYRSGSTAHVYLREGRIAGYGASASSTSELWIPSDSTADTYIVGFAVKPTTTSLVPIIRFYIEDSLGINIRVDGSTGEVQIRRSSTLVGTTTNAGITQDVWSYVEVKFTVHQTAGTVDVKVNGTLRLSLTDVDTQYDSTRSFYDTFGIYLSTWHVDDVYICDDTGSLNNDWLGIRQIIGLFPNGDSTTQWTPSIEGTHYSLVDEPTGSTSDYIESGTADQTDLWNYEDISGVGEIAGIQINTVCQEMDAQSFLLKTPVESNSTQYDDSGMPNYSNAVIEKTRVVETDPDTDSLWTMTGLNSAKFGVKLA